MYWLKGDIRNYDDVYAFGKTVDALTIEIENVNIDALEQLEKEGKPVFPKTSVLRTIKNKIAQKGYYESHSIPTAAYSIVQNRKEIEAHLNKTPLINKIAEGGYDGKGVILIKTPEEITQAFDAPGILEEKIQVAKEIAVIIAVSQTGEMAIYPPVAMVFNNDLHLLDYQLCPIDLDDQIFYKVEAIAISTVKHFNSAGIFAVEMFIDTNGQVLVNETAPRVHNSGHHTIEGIVSSQFDMLWRVILNYPLGSTQIIAPSVLINVIGEPGYNGNAYYQGLEDVLAIEKAYVHLYGKAQVKPGRKMGHVTILGNSIADVLHEVMKVKKSLKAISK
jgi:5-(carboxyamino)imidazole ribonucleotide synthase